MPILLQLRGNGDTGIQRRRHALRVILPTTRWRGRVKRQILRRQLPVDRVLKPVFSVLVDLTSNRRWVGTELPPYPCPVALLLPDKTVVRPIETENAVVCGRFRRRNGYAICRPVSRCSDHSRRILCFLFFAYCAHDEKHGTGLCRTSNAHFHRP